MNRETGLGFCPLGFLLQGWYTIRLMGVVYFIFWSLLLGKEKERKRERKKLGFSEDCRKMKVRFGK